MRFIKLAFLTRIKLGVKSCFLNLLFLIELKEIANLWHLGLNNLSSVWVFNGISGINNEISIF